jgi:flagellar basal-body rod modification protein FlgD
MGAAVQAQTRNVRATRRAATAGPQITPSEICSAVKSPAELRGMTSTPIAGSSGASTGSSGTIRKNKELKSEDFIKMMITQLQNQDPLEPAKNDQMLAQMSQISQLQSSTNLNESLKGMVMQNQIGSASSLIGKSVQGMAGDNETVSGTVTSVKVESDAVKLELDNGRTLELGRVTSIGPAAPHG